MTNEQLVGRIQAGEAPADAMAQLYEQNRGYIRSIAQRYSAYEDVEDLEQEAIFGLYEAVRRFDVERGCKFLTYAEHWIRQSIQRYIENNACCLRLPAHARGSLMQYKRLCTAFQQEYNRMPTDAETAAHLGLTLEQVASIKKDALRGNLGNLDSPVKGLEDENITLGDSVADPFDLEDEVLSQVNDEELRAVLWGIVDGLEGMQPDVIRRRYQGGETLAAIGQAYGVTGSVIRQTEAKALRELRKSENSKQLRPFFSEAEKIYSMGILGNGIYRFNQTWTSSTERAALRLME